MKTPKKLLSKGTTNAKTAKNKLTTFILYLSPAAQNNKKVNLCPFASKGCLKACLYLHKYLLLAHFQTVPIY